jgi:GT2 family glycosyltransferase
MGAWRFLRSGAASGATSGSWAGRIGRWSALERKTCSALEQRLPGHIISRHFQANPGYFHERVEYRDNPSRSPCSLVGEGLGSLKKGDIAGGDQGSAAEHRRARVAIPACNEAARVEKCLAALALQRDECGAPVPRGSFEIIVLANNCSDRTADRVRASAGRIPHPVKLVETTLPDQQANAGYARKHVMDLAAVSLLDRGSRDGVILTTDADSIVSPTWFAANIAALDQGADCIAGYIDGDPEEIIGLGPAFLARGRVEDAYLRLVAEIYARFDPRPHDPWPNHRVSSGASLAVRLSAYLAVGGLPPRPLGEDIGFTQALEDAGLKVRHAMTVSVTTSCRLDGRARGGAADTMLYRYEVPDAPCDDELEPALQTTRRAIYRGLLRRFWAQPSGKVPVPAWGIDADLTAMISKGSTFTEVWAEICQSTPQLRRGAPLRPSDLPRQIAIARMILRSVTLKTAPTDKHRRAELSEPAEQSR